jgi:hypothetical protein
MNILKIFGKKNIKDFEKDTEPKNNIAGAVKGLVDPKKITKEMVIKQAGLIFLLFFFAIIYIANRFNAESLVRESTQLKFDRNELRSEHIATASELMFISKQSEIIHLVDSLKVGLIENTEPPIKIKVAKTE